MRLSHHGNLQFNVFNFLNKSKKDDCAPRPTVPHLPLRLFQGAAASLLPRLTEDLAFCSRIPRGLTANRNKISVIGQLAYKNKAFIIVLQETHSTTADKLVSGDSQLLTSWVKQEARPWHVCSRVVGMFTGRPVSRAIRD